jgi:hypothetical protein
MVDRSPSRNDPPTSTENLTRLPRTKQNTGYDKIAVARCFLIGWHYSYARPSSLLIQITRNGLRKSRRPLISKYGGNLPCPHSTKRHGGPRPPSLTRCSHPHSFPVHRSQRYRRHARKTLCDTTSPLSCDSGSESFFHRR